MLGLLFVSSLEFMTYCCFDKTWMDWIIKQVPQIYEKRTDVVKRNDVHDEVTIRESSKISKSKTSPIEVILESKRERRTQQSEKNLGKKDLLIYLDFVQILKFSIRIRSSLKLLKES